jgi:hypothetical protein
VRLRWPDEPARDLGIRDRLRVETIDRERRTWLTLEVGRRAPGGGRLARVATQPLVLDEAFWTRARKRLGGPGEERP